MFELGDTVKQEMHYSMSFTYLFIYDLYSDIVSCTDYVASNGAPFGEH
jgi:hypothetical protein